jgi:hypothetical protein
MTMMNTGRMMMHGTRTASPRRIEDKDLNRDSNGVLAPITESGIWNLNDTDLVVALRVS